MLTYPRAFLAAAVVAASGLLAQDRPLTVGAPITISKIIVEPEFGSDGRISKFVMAIDYAKVEAPPSGLINVTHVASIHHDLLGGTDTVLVGETVENGVMAGGILYEDREVAAIIEAVAMREYRKAFPGPLPTRKAPDLARSADAARRSVRVP